MVNFDRLERLIKEQGKKKAFLCELAGKRRGYISDAKAGNGSISKEILSSVNLRNGMTKSCGCLSSEVHKVAVRPALDKRKEDKVEGTDIKLLMHAPIKSNTSGKTGVSYDKSVKTWKATIVFKGHKYYLGSSVDREVAVAIREEAEKQIHGAFLDWYYTAVKGLDNPNGPPAP